MESESDHACSFQAETRGASGSSGDYSEPEPKKVQVVNTTPQFGGVQTYETQYSEPHRYDDRRGQEGGGGGHSGQGHSRHGSTGGQKSADAVNFTSLDNLMADLGSMLTYPKDGNGNVSTHFDQLCLFNVWSSLTICSMF